MYSACRSILLVFLSLLLATDALHVADSQNSLRDIASFDSDGSLVLKARRRKPAKVATVRRAISGTEAEDEVEEAAEAEDEDEEKPPSNASKTSTTGGGLATPDFDRRPKLIKPDGTDKFLSVVWAGNRRVLVLRGNGSIARYTTNSHFILENPPEDETGTVFKIKALDDDGIGESFYISQPEVEESGDIEVLPKGQLFCLMFPTDGTGYHIKFKDEAKFLYATGDADDDPIKVQDASADGFNLDSLPMARFYIADLDDDLESMLPNVTRENSDPHTESPEDALAHPSEAGNPDGSEGR